MADGLFDPVLGRIHVPAHEALADRPWLTRVLRHEFVHALLHDQLGPASSAIRTWLNEGLAMELSGDRWSDLEQILAQEFTLIPLPALEGGWGGLSSDAATVAYLEANSAVHYLIDRFMSEVRELSCTSRQGRRSPLPCNHNSRCRTSNSSPGGRISYRITKRKADLQWPYRVR